MLTKPLLAPSGNYHAHHLQVLAAELIVAGLAVGSADAETVTASYYRHALRGQ